MPPDNVFSGSLRHFVSNQRKCLSMNNLQLILGFPGQDQSSSVKPNQGWSRNYSGRPNQPEWQRTTESIVNKYRL
jgi:hypothetical protein